MKEDFSCLEVIDTYYPCCDGPVNVAANYARCLNKKANCALMAPQLDGYVGGKQPFDEYLVKSLGVPFDTGGYRMPAPLLDKTVKETLKDNHFDIVHCHSPFMLSDYMANFCNKNGIPSVFTFHTKFKSDFFRVTKSETVAESLVKIIVHTISKFDFCLAVSDGSADCLREYGYRGKIEIVRNGTDLVYPDNADVLKARAAKSLPCDGKPILLFVGRMVENKNVDFALRALALAKKQGADFTFLGVGDGDYLDTLKAHAKKLGIAENCVWTGKIMDRQLLSGFYLNSDLFVFPSTFDTASLIPLEAAALCVPSLLVEGSCTAEIVKDDFNGWTAPLEEQVWADKICSVLGDKTKLAQVKKECHKSVYRTWDDVADEVLKKYHEFYYTYKSAKK